MLIATLRSFYSYCCAFHKPNPSADFPLLIITSLASDKIKDKVEQCNKH